jgi:hypothetical protein
MGIFLRRAADALVVPDMPCTRMASHSGFKETVYLPFGYCNWAHIAGVM